MFLLLLWLCRTSLVGIGSGETRSSRCRSGNRSSTNSWLSCLVFPTLFSFFSALSPLPTAPRTHWSMCSSDLTAGNNCILTNLCKQHSWFHVKTTVWSININSCPDFWFYIKVVPTLSIYYISKFLLGCSILIAIWVDNDLIKWIGWKSLCGRSTIKYSFFIHVIKKCSVSSIKMH